MRKFLLLMILALHMPAFSISMANENAARNEELERRVMQLSEELRCLVCQNQSIAESNAELAVDLKNQVREKLSSGMQEQEVIDFMVQRYGDFVLYRPPVKTTTMILWFSPVLFLVLALAALFKKVKKQGQPVTKAASTLTDTQAARADALLYGDRLKDGS
ncbi:cytochrome c-type biogenesis protein [Noviherbaspirillum sp. CPCC 100848]|uniref:Cytochrome c-type biogenesis protein n=1 Tax=Noviherbaspirillum album TaxID=3080276 RepID=A0ABU6JJJ3_9BURK|nr:cytochrome c-type biogenesis protein [Noviherbaspirillum sp. CPCC 100848]MEC4723636.1 cytochrome c-type biogenesis protein [Noviherbaspirillum sp. CPCC 100848]